MKLGRQTTPPVKRAANSHLEPLLPAELPIAPPSYELSPLVPLWPMYGNDRLSDCACAAPGHMMEVFTDQVDGSARTLSDNDIIALYETQGYNPADPSTDQGCNMLDVLKAWRKI